MTIQEIKDQTCIVELVSDYTELAGRGNRLRAVKGRNPIRTDGSGDFDVFQDTQRYYDQGTDAGGDVIEFVQVVENLNKSDALTFLEERLGGSTLTSRPLPRRKSQPAELTEERYRQIVSDIERFDRSDKQTFSDDGYKQSALSIAPMWVYNQAQKVDIQLIREFTTYDEVERSIVLKLHNYEGKLISYKHRYKMLNGERKKWCVTPGTHPNKQCMVNIPSSNNNCPVFVAEGSRDFLTAVLLGLNVVAIPNVNYREWTQTELSILTGRKVILIPDLDPEFKGVNCMNVLAAQLTGAKSINVINITKILDFAGIRHNDPKMDFSDVVNLWTKGSDEFISTLSHLTFIREIV